MQFKAQNKSFLRKGRSTKFFIFKELYLFLGVTTIRKSFLRNYDKKEINTREKNGKADGYGGSS
jgi:hypothetical protein